MAYLDYICCTDCHGKVVYDGDHTKRDWLMERFGVDSLLCPTCTLIRAERSAVLVKTCAGRWRAVCDKDMDDSLKIIRQLRAQIAKVTPKRKAR